MKRLDVKPSVYIPTLYVIEGLPYTVVTQMSVVFFKNLNCGNEFIGMATSLLSLPWTMKLIWAPLVDLYGTRRSWIICCQAILALLIGLVSAVVVVPNAVWQSLYIFAAIGFVSATQDVAIDGYYMDVLDKQKQSLYVGVRNAAYKISWLLGQGGLVWLAGKAAENPALGVTGGWAISFGLCSALIAVAAVFHRFALPHTSSRRGEDGDQKGDIADSGEAERKEHKTDEDKSEAPSASPAEKDDNASQTKPGARTPMGRLSLGEFARVFLTFFDQPRIFAVVFYILTFRLGDAFMLKMAQPFLLDPIEKGGLGLSTESVGIVYGTVGTIFLLIGGITGSWLVAKFGLRRCLWPTAIVQNSAILCYWMLALWKPGIVWVAVVNSWEQFSYGLGVAAYTVYLLGTVKPEYKAAHYAIATAMMAVGLLLPGMISGYVQTALGYPTFFLLSFLASIPGIITIFFLPLQGPAKQAGTV